MSGDLKAFPGIKGPPSEFSEGMDLRDWFAGMAIAEFIKIHVNVPYRHGDASPGTRLKIAASQAYALADAMIAARKGGAA